MLDGLAKELFEAYPAPTLIVDEDVRLVVVNRAARVMLGAGPDDSPFANKRVGEALRCVHAYGPGGCGKQEACHGCVLRNSVTRALAAGVAGRTRTFLRLRTAAGEVEVGAFVSASRIAYDGRPHAAVTLEHVSDVELKGEVLRAEQALRESEERFRSVMEQAADAFFLHDAQGRFLDVNRQACESLGYAREELLRMSVPDVEVDFDLAAAQREWAKIRPGQPFTLLGHNRRKDGTVFPVEVRFARVDLRGEPLFVGLSRDITDRLRSEQVLREREERLRVTLGSIGDAVVATDEAGRVTLVNAVAEQLTGFSAAEAMGRPLGQIFHAVDEETSRPAVNPVEEVLAKGVIATLAENTALVARDGTRRPIADSAAPIRDAGGRVSGVVLVFRDQTEERRAERARRESESRLRLLFERLPQLVWTADGRGQVDYFSQSWRDYTGQPRGREALEPALHPEDRQRVREAWRTAVAEGGEVEVEHRLRRADGEYRWFIRRAFQLRDGDGTTLRWIGTCTDIHDLKVSQEVLRQADRLKEDFLFMASHEFRSPLTALRLQAELMRRQVQRGEGSGARVERHLAAIDVQIGRLDELLRTLLDLSRINSGRLTLDLEELDLSAVVREAVERFRPEAEDAGTELRVRMASVVGRWDRARIDQVVTNLVGNAIKYGDRQPVEIELDERAGAAVLVVRDRGIGMAPGTQAQIFDRLVRGTNAGVAKGLGLGLWIVKKMVEAHGGEVTVSSALGEGSTFTVSLPCSRG